MALNKIRISELIVTKDLIGHGTSPVFKGLYQNTLVAVKVVNLSQRDSFKMEVAIHCDMEHDNIVKFIGYTMKPSRLIITEFMDGGTLRDLTSRLDLDVSLRLALGISRALEYMHARRIVHGDIKSANILLSKDKLMVKVADFGEAKHECHPDAGFIGFEGKKDRKADINQFSIVLRDLFVKKTKIEGIEYSMAAHDTFEGGSLQGLPADIESLISSMRTGSIEIGEISNRLANISSTL